MDLISAILNRRSIRSFKPDPVPRNVLKKLIETSKWSPSGSNTQPWEFIVLGGPVMEEVKRRLNAAMKPGPDGQAVPAHPDIPYPPMPEPFVSRQKAMGKQMQGFISRPDPRTTAANFFGAPNGVIVLVEKELTARAWLGIGMIAQTLCLAALEHGLGTCLMSMVTYWPEFYREMFHIPDSKLICFGVAIGYPDFEAPINNFPRTRLNLDEFTAWHGFAE